MTTEKRPIETEHHQQQDLCTTRPAYRQGRNLTAVKTYTISTESQHLFVYGVPKINLRPELRKLCSNYGQIMGMTPMIDYKTEIFTECYHMHYQRIQSARIAKRFLDNKSFYGGILHVCYAPEFETIEETRQKLLQRTKDVMTRLNQPDFNLQQANTSLAGAVPMYVHPSQEFSGTYNLSDEYNSGHNFGNINWPDAEGSNGSIFQPQNNALDVQGPSHTNYNNAQSNNSTVERTQQRAAYTWKETETTQGKTLLPRDGGEYSNDRDGSSDEIKTSFAAKKHKQTPAYYWKEAADTTVPQVKSRKRSGNFVPWQVAKKRRHPET